MLFALCSVGMGIHCENKRITNGMWKMMLVFNSEKKGLGIESLEVLEKDVIIDE